MTSKKAVGIFRIAKFGRSDSPSTAYCRSLNYSRRLPSLITYAPIRSVPGVVIRHGWVMAKKVMLATRWLIKGPRSDPCPVLLIAANDLDVLRLSALRLFSFIQDKKSIDAVHSRDRLPPWKCIQRSARPPYYRAEWKWKTDGNGLRGLR